MQCFRCIFTFVTKLQFVALFVCPICRNIRLIVQSFRSLQVAGSKRLSNVQCFICIMNCHKTHKCCSFHVSEFSKIQMLKSNEFFEFVNCRFVTCSKCQIYQIVNVSKLSSFLICCLPSVPRFHISTPIYFHIIPNCAYVKVFQISLLELSMFRNCVFPNVNRPNCELDTTTH